MKIFIKTFGLLLLIFVIQSCTKTEQIEIEKAHEITENVSIIDERLVFSSESKFEEYVLQLDEESLNEWENSLEFYSLRSSIIAQNDGIDEEDIRFPTESMRFCSVLNQYNIVQVGEWIFKLNFDKREVWAISEVNKELITNLKKGELVSDKILVFSFEDDVFDLLDNDEKQLKWGCDEECAYSTQEKQPGANDYWYCDEDGDEFGAQIKNDLDNLGIWKHLYTRFEHRKKGCCNASDEYVLFDVGFSYSWKKKCRNETDAGTEQAEFTIWGNLSEPSMGRTYRKDHYEGTRCLSEYSLISEVWFGTPAVCGGGLHHIPTNGIQGN